jgi:hypothetical protein
MASKSRPTYANALESYRAASAARSARVNRVRNRVREALETEAQLRRSLRALPDADPARLARVRARLWAHVQRGGKPSRAPRHAPYWTPVAAAAALVLAVAAVFGSDPFRSARDRAQVEAVAQSGDPAPRVDRMGAGGPKSVRPAPPEVPQGAQALSPRRTGSRMTVKRVRASGTVSLEAAMAHLEHAQAQLAACWAAHPDGPGALEFRVDVDRFGRLRQVEDGGVERSGADAREAQLRNCVHDVLAARRLPTRAGVTAAPGDDSVGGRLSFRLVPGS